MWAETWKKVKAMKPKINKKDEKTRCIRVWENN
jgi:hypothetical protein